MTSSLLVVSGFLLDISLSSPASMSCDSNSTYANVYNGYHDNVQSSLYLSGVEASIFDAHYADRIWKWRYCQQTQESNGQTFTSWFSLTQTSYGDAFSVSCGDDSAMIGATSTYNNYTSDRSWQWYCGVLDTSKYSLTDCFTTEFLNDYTSTFTYYCPYNNVINQVSSLYDNDREDRGWYFVCCTISDVVPSPTTTIPTKLNFHHRRRRLLKLTTNTTDPTSDPTSDPTKDPTSDPTKDPTSHPAKDPTRDPTSDPTSDPTKDPTKDPTSHPAKDPTSNPTGSAVTESTDSLTESPTNAPSNAPSNAPTSAPSNAPTCNPSPKVCVDPPTWCHETKPEEPKLPTTIRWKDREDPGTEGVTFEFFVGCYGAQTTLSRTKQSKCLAKTWNQQKGGKCAAGNNPCVVDDDEYCCYEYTVFKISYIKTFIKQFVAAEPKKADKSRLFKHYKNHLEAAKAAVKEVKKTMQDERKTIASYHCVKSATESAFGTGGISVSGYLKEDLRKSCKARFDELMVPYLKLINDHAETEKDQKEWDEKAERWAKPKHKGGGFTEDELNKAMETDAMMSPHNVEVEYTEPHSIYNKSWHFHMISIISGLVFISFIIVICSMKRKGKKQRIDCDSSDNDTDWSEEEELM